jgi:hypothetical protein
MDSKQEKVKWAEIENDQEQEHEHPQVEEKPTTTLITEPPKQFIKDPVKEERKKFFNKN